MTVTETARPKVAAAGTAFLRAFFEYAAHKGTLEIVANDFHDLRAKLKGLDDNYEDSHVRSAIKSLHHGGAIECGHAPADVLSDPNYRNGRSYKVRLLIKPFKQ